MAWLLLATLGQFLNALVAILDKFIVTDKQILPRPFVYAFYSCLITGGWILVFLLGYIPGLATLGVPTLENVQAPTIQVVGMSFLAAYTFFMALVSMYDALKHADASDVMPVIGAIAALSSFGMAYVFLQQTLSENVIWGVSLLIIGTALVSQVRFTPSIILMTVHSGLFFALHNIAMKGLFQETSFDDGFFWSRIGLVLFGLSLLLVPTYVDKIRQQTKQTTRRGGIIILLNKVVAGVAAFMLLKATDLGDVTVVQALDGLKYVFIIVVGLVLGRHIPFAAGENEFDLSTVMRKVLYISIITIGFVMLFR